MHRWGLCALVVCLVAACPATAGAAPTAWSGGALRLNDPAMTFGGDQRGVREPVIAIDPSSPNVVLAAAIDQNPQNQVPEADGWGGWNHIYRSTDGGATWSDGPMIHWPDPSHTWSTGDPSLAFAADGTAYLVSLNVNIDQPHKRQIEVYRSNDQGQTWSGPTLAFDGTYDPANGRCVSGDKELGTVDQRTGELLVVYTQTTWGCGSVPDDFFTDEVGTVPPDGVIQVVLTRSSDGGSTWTKPQPIWNDHYAIGAKPVVGPDGTIYVAFSAATPLGSNLSCPSTLGTLGSYALRGATLVVASSHDDGATWSYEKRGLCEAVLAEEQKSDQEGKADPTLGAFVPTISVDPVSGRAVVAWPTFAAHPPAASFGVKTMSSTDGGQTWSPTTDLTPPAQDAVLPALASDAGRTWATWVASTDDWNTYSAYAAESTGGDAWSAPLTLSSEAGTAGGEIGDYVSMDAAGGRVAAIWTQGDPSNGLGPFARTGTYTP